MQEHRQEINALYYGLLSLSVYRRVTEQPVTGAVTALVKAAAVGDKAALCSCCGTLCATLAAAGRLDSLTSAMAEEVLADDNAYSELLSSGEQPPERLQQAAVRDLGVLYKAATLCREDIAAGLDTYVAAVLPGWGTDPAPAPMDQPWDRQPEALADYHARHGCGRFAKHIAFLWRDGALLPVEHPDPIRLSNLKGYEYQRRIAIDKG